MEKRRSIKIPIIILYGAILTVEHLYAIATINPNTDAFFLINTGKLIVENLSLPKTSVWTVHNTEVIIQQPLICLLNYAAYYLGGYMGIRILSAIFSAIGIWAIYRLVCSCEGIRNNRMKNIAIVVISSAGLIEVISTRPYIVTFSLLSLFTCCCMDYINGKISLKRCIIYAYILTMLQSNFQAASLIFYVGTVFMFAVPIKIIPGDELKKQAKLLWLVPVAMLGSISNPNGIKAPYYLVDAMLSGKVRRFDIAEMRPLSLFSINGFLFVAGATFFVIYLIINRKKSSNYIVWMFVAYSAMTVMALRNYFLMTIPVVIILDNILDNETVIKWIDFKTVCSKKVYYLCIALFVAAFIIITDVIFVSEIEKTTLKQIDETKSLKHFTDCIDREGARVFCGFNSGAAFEMAGCLVYFDARPETFTDEIIDEFFEVYEGNIDYKAFLDKYDFDYLYVGEDEYIYDYVLSDTDYEEVYYEDSFHLYQKVE